MKRLFYIGWLCLLFVACSREELLNLSGTPASLILSINTMQNDEKTRAVSPEQAEKRIFNLYIFVFNKDGSIDYQKYHPLNESTIESTKISINGLTCGSEKSVAAIVNIENANTIVAIKSSTLDAITSRSELEEIVVNMQTQSLERGTSFLTSGITENVTVSAEGATPVTVLLKRVDAKIRFNINTIEGVTFIPSDWRVVSIPSRISVMGAHLDLCSSEADCFDTDWAKFEDGGATFAFYSMEHLLNPKAQIASGGTDAERYALREKQEKIPTGSGNSVKNGAFVYAPATGTYVEMRGHVRYTQHDEDISADVIYTVHLGGVEGANDYNTLRNTFYTYNVKIVSVNAIEIEVASSDKTEEELRPGAEGDVTVAKKILNLDAYNETFTLAFNQSDVDESLTWNVYTPFSKGSEVENPLDYKWIYFRINEKTLNGLRYNDDFRIYPGDQNVYSGEVTLSTYIADIERGEDKLLDVKQLVALLKASKEIYLQPNAKHLFDSDYNAKFTAYVNEYYYETNPKDISVTAVGGLWKQFTNQQQRVMNILSQLKYSPDHESSKSNAVYSISQHAIQTMYNRSLNEANYTAWGTQMIQDETPVVFDTEFSMLENSPASDHSNGRKNTFLMWLPSSKRWDDYIMPNTWSMKSDYNTAKYKCLRMNRDSNGSGVIDESEVQWYLAAINQLTDIWIGEWSYDPTARLYKNKEWVEQYFVSSTVSSRSGFVRKRDNPQILWSSEGSSIGFLADAAGAGGVDTPVYYRCVRNLGVPRDADLKTVPNELAEYDTETHRMSLKRLDAQSIRGYYQTTEELPQHHEREATNKPYWAFEVSSTPVGGDKYTWQSLFEYIQSGARLCPNGYRVPNQRELALMLSRIGNDGHWTLNNHFSRTRFQFDSDRPGFSVKVNDGFLLYLLHGNTEKGGVRCVKDLLNE